MANNIFMKTMQNNGVVSKLRYNREYLLSNSTASELNTYINFKPFRTFNDIYDPEYIESSGKYIENADNPNGPGTPGTRSIFNKYGAVVLGSSDGSLDVDVRSNASEWRISNNVPLMDSRDARKRIRANSGCSVKELVEASRAGILGRATYSYSDFMYCKHLGKVSNNYLITLRRFPIPVDDYISSIGEANRNADGIGSQNSECIGCMVTWLGTSGNEMSNILKYSTSMPFKDQESTWEQDSTSADGKQGIFNQVAATFDSTYREQYMQGTAGGVYSGEYLGKFFSTDVPYNASEFIGWQDQNKVYGPIDAIKSTYIRDKEGLKFEHSFNLVFDYELRSYNGINGRQAMLDLISNILNVTYSTGTFWKGGYRSTGAHQNNVFTNMKIFKAKGGFTDYVDSFIEDVSTVKNSISASLGDNPLQAIKNFMNDIGGMIIGGWLNKMGRPQKTMLNSLLSPAPVGFWHVTIGNPHHPIMSMGNMIVKKTSIEHYGPLGLDDFPTGLKVTIELDRGKPRDIRDIEKLYMHGNDRIYHPMGPKLEEMYKNAKDYKGNKNTGIASNNTELLTNSMLVGLDNLGANNDIIKHHFSKTADRYSIQVAAQEQEYGAHTSNKQSK